MRVEGSEPQQLQVLTRHSATLAGKSAEPRPHAGFGRGDRARLFEKVLKLSRLIDRLNRMRGRGHAANCCCNCRQNYTRVLYSYPCMDGTGGGESERARGRCPAVTDFGALVAFERLYSTLLRFSFGSVGSTLGGDLGLYPGAPFVTPFSVTGAADDFMSSRSSSLCGGFARTLTHSCSSLLAGLCVEYIQMSILIRCCVKTTARQAVNSQDAGRLGIAREFVRIIRLNDICASAATQDLGLKEGREGLAEVDVGVNALKLCALLTPKFILALLDERYLGCSQLLVPGCV